ncbi:hypothetical protein A2917_02770 [Candidatus Nomurabacteria bacterium RIFCSPLOWO2_01_FULL_42_17]|uniref:Uncharacterized protein n=1 Tax=Candidatus Nomurabacteria bacterium RIFCSPLOWO2_01_FULL_42_17 TaxID=1801780 RepID=A0A1F6XMT5_9BACT|nr:MAG: hypothetical protein A2917_02770 [Candidatus Nomurabacteria bacterium RIFCSPLOWO2_01_FULL_42_17]
MDTTPEISLESKKTIFERVKKLNFPIGKYVVVGGVMEAHGIRKAVDVDFIVTKELFDDLLKQGWVPKPCRPGDIGKEGEKRKLRKDDISIISEYSWLDKYFAKTEDLIANADIIDGIPFISLSELLKWKKACGREKDLIDIELIENYLKKKGN